ncbi:restriction endonuclease subunit S [Ligilactobacillus salivarius]|uniref:restriction endonuclease subunit S n=1 Tax=Ligilactobacillus salivarius TaxID=1624 RepID=UPI0018758E9A|nr:restriction endonuclease subunit S [Ligilactobacillus salivarius]MBE5066403.1 restriction endonuclease subunit S [Ligilactobacillus salivarius]
MAKEEKKAPKLRFNGYTNDWERKKLGDIVEFYSGLTYKPENIAQSGTLVIRSSNIHNSKYVNADNVYVKNNIVNSEYVKKQDIVVVVRNGSRNLIGKHALLTSIPHNPSVIGAFMTGIRSSDNQFIETLLNTEQFKREINKNLGATINQITTSQFKKMRFHVSKQKENKQIGVLFTYLDNSINLHERKCEELALIKKALLQKLFPKKDEIKPEVRYKNFSDAWEQRKLNEFLKTSKLKNENNKFTRKDVLSVSGDYGIVNQIKFKGRSFAGASVQKYRIVNTNNVVYTKSPLKNNPYGIIKANKGNPGIVSTLYAVYKINEKVNASFIEYYFENDYRLNTYLKPLVNKGAKNDMKVSDDNALIGNVIFPLEYSEQIKIVKFLNRFDTLIALHQRKLERLKQLKKFLLQNMFI